MILYFDSYITDIPLNKNTLIANDDLRMSCPNYTMPSKVDIAKYTLDSYAQYDWDHVLIKYEVDDVNDYEVLDKYILDLFPFAIIVHKRSTSFNAFQESLKVINSFESNWVFYTGNNDHPWVGESSEYVDGLVSMASQFEDKYDFISILYTHFSESLNLNIKNTPMSLLYGRDIEDIEENSQAKIILRKQGDNTSAQIVNKKLLNYWFSTNKYPEERIIRSEDIRKFFTVKNQLMIIPKKEICAHFDGYSHTLGTVSEIANYQVPPLFIPQGFFTSDIKICYGYNEYRPGWVNINPINEKYIFEDKSGADLKIALDKLPIFWNKRISESDVNNNLDLILLRDRIIQNNKIIKSPWSLSSKKLSSNTIFFIVRYLIVFFWVRSFLVKLTHHDVERRNYIKKIYSVLRVLKTFILNPFKPAP